MCSREGESFGKEIIPDSLTPDFPSFKGTTCLSPSLGFWGSKRPYAAQ